MLSSRKRLILGFRYMTFAGIDNSIVQLLPILLSIGFIEIVYVYTTHREGRICQKEHMCVDDTKRECLASITLGIRYWLCDVL